MIWFIDFIKIIASSFIGGFLCVLFGVYKIKHMLKSSEKDAVILMKGWVFGVSFFIIGVTIIVLKFMGKL